MYIEYKWIILISIILISLASYLLIYYPSTMNFYVENPFWNGYSSFVNLFNVTVILTRFDFTRELSSITSNDILLKNTVLVTISYENYTSQEIRLLEKFVIRGGTLIVLDDFSPAGNQLLYRLNVDLHFNATGVLMDPLYYYKDPHLPEVEARINNKTYTVVLNYASIIEGDINENEILMRSSRFSYLDLDNSSSWSPDEPTGPFIVGVIRKLGAGEIIIISDPSIWLNVMLGIKNNNDFANVLLGGKKVYLDQVHIPKSTQELLRERIIYFTSLLNSYGITPLIVAAFAIVVYRLFLGVRLK